MPKKNKGSKRSGQRMREAIARGKRMHDMTRRGPLIPDAILRRLQEMNLPNDKRAWNERLKELLQGA